MNDGPRTGPGLSNRTIDRVLGGLTVAPTERPALRLGLLDLWVAVTDAGGSVGFTAPADRGAIAASLDRELAE